MRRPRSVVSLVLIGFAVVMLPLIAGLLLASHVIGRLGVESEQTVNHAIALTRQTHRLVEALDAMERTARQYHVLRDGEARSLFLSSAANFWQRAEDLAEQAEDQRAKTQIAQLARDGENIRRFVMRLSPQHGWPMQLTRNFASMRADTGALLERSREQVAAEVEAMRQRAREAQRGLLIQVAIIVLAAAALALLFTVLLTRPIRQLDQGIRALADPDAPLPKAIRGPRDLQALEQRLHWVRHRLQHADQERSRLLGQVSHELKTPLAALREGVSLLREHLLGPMTDEQMEVARILDEKAAQLQSHIEDLLRYNRAQRDCQPARLERMRLRPVLEEVLAQHALSLKSRQVTTQLRVPASLTVKADHDMLRTILDNLVSNAIKYSVSDGRVEIRASTADNGVRIEVADNGQGVAENERGRLFEPFFRGSAPASGQLSGSGLGLAISRELARSHGGELRLIDRPGWNTVFELFLPGP